MLQKILRGSSSRRKMAKILERLLLSHRMWLGSGGRAHCTDSTSKLDVRRKVTILASCSLQRNRGTHELRVKVAPGAVAGGPLHVAPLRLVAGTF